MSDEITLREWSNAKRFIPSRFSCPECGNAALEDTWPPNYAGGHGGINAETKVYFYTSGGNVKCVCKTCRLAFKMAYQKTIDGKSETYEEHAHSIVPLEERNGMWLTPHDVWRENYKDEHGEYPRESYG